MQLMKFSSRYIALNVMVKVENWVRKYALEWRESDPGKGGHLNKHRGSQPLSALVTPLCYVPSPHYNKYVNFKRTFNIGIKDDYRGAITSASNEFHFSITKCIGQL